MKKTSLALLFSVVACPVFAGAMGDVSSTLDNSTYVSIAGGYYGGNYQSNYTNYSLGALSAQQSFNDSNASGYAQLGLGANAHLGSLLFDHQLTVSKLLGGKSFNTSSSHWSDSQNVDFGYDLMPKISLMQKFGAYGILGVHYARFTYQKLATSSPLTTVEYNNYYDQIGFNLGAGVNYEVNEKFTVGLKYQHLQYKSIQVNGTNLSGTSIDIEQTSPGFNLVGVELRYYFN